MRNALLEPARTFTSGDLLGVFLILLAGAIIAFIVAGLNRLVLYVLGLYREVLGLCSYNVLIDQTCEYVWFEAFEYIRFMLLIEAARCFACAGQSREED